MWSRDQSLVTLALVRGKISQPQFYKDLTRKTLTFYTSVAKTVEIKSQKIFEDNSKICRSYTEKMVGGPFCSTHPE